MLHEVRLSDYMKTRHQLAFAEVEKLRKSLNAPADAEKKLSPLKPASKVEEDEESEQDEELELRASAILMASFCENLPKDAVPEISLDDQLPISRHIEKVTTEYAKRQGLHSTPKKLRPGPAIR